MAEFPSNRFEALTMLYLKNQDLSDLSPSELFTKYNEVYAEIKEARQKARYNKDIDGGI